MDKIDISTDRTLAETDAIVANRTIYSGVSARDCLDCGDPIPQGRREAVPGTRRCTDCETIHQRRRAQR